MKITDIHVDGFGVWNGLEIPDLQNRVTVFYGRNEAGKTTLLQFVRTVLYGYSPERRRRYFPPIHGGAAGGVLGVTSPSGIFKIHRRAEGRGVGEITIEGPSGATQGGHLLNILLAGVDEATFNNVFAVGLREIQELGTLDDTEAADRLYNLTSGLDRVSLVDVMRDIDAARSKLLADDGSEGELLRILADREKLQGEIDRLSGHGRQWAKLGAQRDAVEQEVARFDQSIKQIEQQGRLLEVAIQVREVWQRREEAREELAELEPLTELPEDAIDTLDRLNAEIAEHRATCDQYKRQRVALREEARALPIDRTLWSASSRVDALCEHVPWIGSLHDQIGRLRKETAELEGALQDRLDHVGLPGRRTPDSLPNITEEAIRALREPAHVIREQSARLKQLQRDRHTYREEALELKKRLNASLAPYGGKELRHALEDVGEQVSLLRRRAQIDERIEQLGAQRHELADQSRALMDEQVLPVRVLTGLGGVFVFGVLMILLALLGNYLWGITAPMAWLLGVVGFGGTMAAGATKFMLERSAIAEFEGSRKQLELLSKQIDQEKRERDDIDRRLPRRNNSNNLNSGNQAELPTSAMLDETERRLRDLEDLLPLDAARQAADAQQEAAGAKATEAAGAIRAARTRWRDELRKRQLPENLTPSQVKELGEEIDEISTLQRRVISRREELNQRERELANLRERVQEVMEELSFSPRGQTLQDQLTELGIKLEHQRELVKRRTTLSRDFKSIHRQHMQLLKTIEKLERRRATLFAQAGVEDEPGLRELADKHELAGKLRKELEQLSGQMRIMIGGRVSEEDIAKELENREVSLLESLWDQTQSRQEELQRNLAKQHERRGEIVAEMKSLGDDRRLLTARLELGCIERRLTEAARQWRVLAVAAMLLETIREVYERERQPETLAEASGYLQRFTESHYTRIWTPLGDNVLQVDDRDGHSLPLEVLSQGTREAVFLSLRLALAAAYARRGAVLPLVLDDVMVNFDVERARAAAVVFRDFAASGGQILVFTCHEHIVEIFGQLGMEVRLLPSNSKSNAVVHPAELNFGEEEPEELVHEATQPAPVVDEEINELLSEEAELAYEDEADIYPLPVQEPAAEEDLDDLIAGIPTAEEERPRNPEPIVYAAWYPSLHVENEDEAPPEAEVEVEEVYEDEYTLADAAEIPQPVIVLPAADEPYVAPPREDEEYRLAPEPPQAAPALVPAVAEERVRRAPPRERLLAWDGPKAWWTE
jgi:uncharacterized protein YhaN